MMGFLLLSVTFIYLITLSLITSFYLEGAIVDIRVFGDLLEVKLPEMAAHLKNIHADLTLVGTLIGFRNLVSHFYLCI
jgi:hypothetical protein